MSAIVTDSAEKKILVTDSARKKILESCKPEEFLRVEIHSGGCNGFSYNFKIDSALQPDDFVQKEDDIILVVMKSALMERILNPKVDYIKNLSSAYFTLESMSFGSTCGCGTSFSIV